MMALLAFQVGYMLSTWPDLNCIIDTLPYVLYIPQHGAKVDRGLSLLPAQHLRLHDA